MVAVVFCIRSFSILSNGSISKMEILKLYSDTIKYTHQRYFVLAIVAFVVFCTGCSISSSCSRSCRVLADPSGYDG